VLAILGLAIMAALIGGLTMLMLVPAMFVWLGYAVFREGMARSAAATDVGALPMPLPEPEFDAQTIPERSRTIGAGRRFS
jgi:hypothetical protein